MKNHMEKNMENEMATVMTLEFRSQDPPSIRSWGSMAPNSRYVGLDQVSWIPALSPTFYKWYLPLASWMPRAGDDNAGSH